MDYLRAAGTSTCYKHPTGRDLAAAVHQDGCPDPEGHHQGAEHEQEGGIGFHVEARAKAAGQALAA